MKHLRVVAEDERGEEPPRIGCGACPVHQAAIDLRRSLNVLGGVADRMIDFDSALDLAGDA